MIRLLKIFKKQWIIQITNYLPFVRYLAWSRPFSPKCLKHYSVRVPRLYKRPCSQGQLLASGYSLIKWHCQVYDWEHAEAVSTVPPDTLDPVVKIRAHISQCTVEIFEGKWNYSCTVIKILKNHHKMLFHTKN